MSSSPRAWQNAMRKGSRPRSGRAAGRLAIAIVMAVFLGPTRPSRADDAPRFPNAAEILAVAVREEEEAQRLYVARDFDAAELHARSALWNRRKASGPDDPGLVHALVLLGSARLGYSYQLTAGSTEPIPIAKIDRESLCHTAEATAIFLEAERILRRSTGVAPADAAAIDWRLGVVSMHYGDCGAALERLAVAVRTWRSANLAREVPVPELFAMAVQAIDHLTGHDYTKHGAGPVVERSIAAMNALAREADGVLAALGTEIGRDSDVATRLRAAVGAMYVGDVEVTDRSNGLLADVLANSARPPAGDASAQRVSPYVLAESASRLARFYDGDMKAALDDLPQGEAPGQGSRLPGEHIASKGQVDYWRSAITAWEAASGKSSLGAGADATARAELVGRLLAGTPRCPLVLAQRVAEAGLVAQRAKSSSGPTVALVRALETRALTHLVCGRCREAVVLLGEAADGWAKMNGRESAEALAAAEALAYTRVLAGNLAAAAEGYAVVAKSRRSGGRKPEEASTLISAAWASLAAGRTAAAATFAKEASPLLAGPFRSDDMTQTRHRRLLRRLGLLAEIDRTYRRTSGVPAEEGAADEVESRGLRGDLRGAVRLSRELVRGGVGAPGTVSLIAGAAERVRLIQLLLEIGAADEADVETEDLLQTLQGSPSNWNTLGTSWVDGVARLSSSRGEDLRRRGLLEEAVAEAGHAYALELNWSRMPRFNIFAPLPLRPVPSAVGGPGSSGLVLAPPLDRDFVQAQPGVRPPPDSHAAESYARVLVATGRDDEAVTVLESAVAALSSQLPPDHPLTLRARVGLARVHLDRGDLERAETEALAAAASLRPSGTPPHPLAVDALLVSADAAALRKHDPDALARYTDALSLAGATLAPDHEAFLHGLAGSALVSARSGDKERAVSAMRRAIDVLVRRVTTLAPGSTQYERLALVASVHWALADWIEICASVGIDGYDEALLLKNVAWRIAVAQERILRRTTSAVQGDVAALRAAQRSLARVAQLVPVSGAERVTWRNEVAEANAKVADLIKGIAKKEPGFRDALAALVPDRAALTAGLRPEDALIDVLLAGGRYVAWVVFAGAEPRRVVLGEATEIEVAVDGLVAEMQTSDGAASPTLLEAATAVRERVWKPIAGVLPATMHRLYLVLDGALCAAPLESLPMDAEGTRLADSYEVFRLTSADDLRRGRGAPGAGRGLLVVGDVDYSNVARAGVRVVTGPRPHVLPNSRFEPLPATAAEIAAVAKVFSRHRSGEPIARLTGDRAGEAELRVGVAGKAMVHLATHGFIRENAVASLRSPFGEAFRLGRGLESHAHGMDPFLLSGVALSGCNSRQREDDDDGILTALEAVELALDGTDLVYLSACDSARGPHSAGEGVAGLVQALTIAGARQVVATLWPIDDATAAALAEAFYAAYLAHPELGAAPALRTAIAQLRRDPRFRTPRTWGAFVAFGVPR